MHEIINTGCVLKKYTIFVFYWEKVNKAQQQHSVAKNIIFLCVRRFLNGIITWSV